MTHTEKSLTVVGASSPPDCHRMCSAAVAVVKATLLTLIEADEV